MFVLNCLFCFLRPTREFSSVTLGIRLGNLRGPVILTPVADRLAVELSLVLQVQAGPSRPRIEPRSTVCWAIALQRLWYMWLEHSPRMRKAGCLNPDRDRRKS